MGGSKCVLEVRRVGKDPEVRTQERLYKTRSHGQEMSLQDWLERARNLGCDTLRVKDIEGMHEMRVAG